MVRLQILRMLPTQSFVRFVRFDSPVGPRVEALREHRHPVTPSPRPDLPTDTPSRRRAAVEEDPFHASPPPPPPPRPPRPPHRGDHGPCCTRPVVAESLNVPGTPGRLTRPVERASRVARVRVRVRARQGERTARGRQDLPSAISEASQVAPASALTPPRCRNEIMSEQRQKQTPPAPAPTSD